ncbi:MAG: 6-carboxytetrahydropterin synthase [Bdellovibrionaceae bacterium]|nr:6-carboxytetrahydropterin synthase [Pseudobdellovibrionaceae bacterium]
MKVLFTRQYLIRALHHLENPALSAVENERLYGVCFRLHGHDYKVQVTIESEVDPATGLCKFRRELDAIVERELIQPFDGKNLNDTFRNTSGEALVNLFYDRLRPHVPQEIRLALAIQETRKNYFERLP